MCCAREINETYFTRFTTRETDNMLAVNSFRQKPPEMAVPKNRGRGVFLFTVGVSARP
jgi:hypothetical protein